MGISRYRYLHYDVFTDRRFGGNQLAIFPEASGLSAAMMQQIAREIGFAESTFVTASEGPDTDVRMRIFTPGTEMPMAGHPVVGSIFALAREGTIAPGRSDWTFGLNIGPTPVSLEWTGSRLDFAWMTQRAPEFGPPLEDIERFAAALGVHADDIASTGVPVQEVSCVYEDPATGSASGPLGSYLVRHSLVTPEQGRSILNLQGVKLGRPSWIHVSIESSGLDISRVRVGGTSVFVAEGVMEVED